MFEYSSFFSSTEFRDLFVGGLVFQPVLYSLMLLSLWIRLHQRTIADFLPNRPLESRSLAVVWALVTSESWIITSCLVGEPSLEDAITVETIIKGSFNVIPVRILNGLSSGGWVNLYFLGGFSCFLKPILGFPDLWHDSGTFRCV